MVRGRIEAMAREWMPRIIDATPETMDHAFMVMIKILDLQIKLEATETNTPPLDWEQITTEFRELSHAARDKAAKDIWLNQDDDPSDDDDDSWLRDEDDCNGEEYPGQDIEDDVRS